MKKLFFKRKEKVKMEAGKAKWNVFNQGEELEFAECSECGHEVNPDMTEGSGYPEGRKKTVASYPDVCPGCRREIAEIYIVPD